MKGKFIKKLVAYALTVAMVAATPMTAFASEFADNFWVSDGVEEHDPMDTGTGTVSSTNTNTGGVVIGSNIKGISICLKGETSPKTSLVIDKGTTPYVELTAKVDFENEDSLSAEEKAKINRKITWRSSNLQIIRPKADYTNRENCRITPYKGGYATITAEMDLDNDGAADYWARLMVKVKKTPTAISLNIPGNKLYAGHTYDLNDYVTFGAPDEFDTVEFSLTGLDPKKQKLVTFGKDGVLKLDKKIKDKDQLKVTITAKVGNLTAEVKDVALSEGVPVKSLKFTDKKPAYDIADDYNKTTFKPLAEKQKKSLTVTVDTKTGADTTDDITWSSSDNRIVRIKSKVLTTEKNNNKPFTVVEFEGLSVGKATVTATSTCGKSAKVTVTVTATLLTLQASEEDAPYVENNTTWSGKTTPIVINRVPKQNKDKLKVTITDKAEKKIVKAKAGINPILTPAADLVKLTADGKTISTVKIEAANKKLNVKPVTVKPFTVKQSDVKLDKVVAGRSSADLNKQKISMNSNRIVTYFAVLDATHNNQPGLDAVSWTSSKETIATVDNGRVNVVGEGSAKITVSSVYKNEKGKYATIKKAFTIKSTPKCEGIELKSNVITVKAGAKTAVVNVKQQLPKKAADNVQWYIYDTDKGELVTTGIDSAKTNNKKCTINTGSYSAGDVITVVAMAGSAQVQAKIVVVAK